MTTSPERLTDTPADTRTDSPADAPAVARSLRVLVADDDAQARALLGAQLTAAGYDVVAEAGTGADAVERAVALTPDVVVLDVHMPDGSGADAAIVIRRGLPGTGVVLVTGDPDAVLTDAEVVGTGAWPCCPSRRRGRCWSARCGWRRRGRASWPRRATRWPTRGGSSRSAS